MTKLRKRQAKILATLGPVSNNPEMIEKLFNAGADAFRLNFSHGDHETHRRTFGYIREFSKKIGRPITILQDLQGPKIRLGDFADDAKITLEAGDTFKLDSDTTLGDKTRCRLPHPEILEVLKEGDKVYINDGYVRLIVKEKVSDGVLLEVTAGGQISSRKGVNLPGVDLPISALTEKDWKDLDLGLELGVDWVAVSFVQREQDIIDVKEKVAGRAAVIAKIEMPQAVERIDGIAEVTDAIMVARGDLGVEMPLEEVPAIQKRLIRKCRELGKPVVVATQMLESMISNAAPTRAETSDVANATYEGADALMLSAESAAGAYPEEAVSTMSRIITRVEESSAWRPLVNARAIDANGFVNDAIAASANATADAINSKIITTFTETGATASRVSRLRPGQKILALTPHENIAARINLSWGVFPEVVASVDGTGDMIAESQKVLEKYKLTEKGEHVVLTAGVPFTKAGSTNFLRIFESE